MDRPLAAGALTRLHYCALRSSAMILSKHPGPASQSTSSPAIPFPSCQAWPLMPAGPSPPLLTLCSSPWKLEIPARPGSEGTLCPGRGSLLRWACFLALRSHPSPSHPERNQACWTLFPCCTTVATGKQCNDERASTRFCPPTHSPFTPQPRNLRCQRVSAWISFMVQSWMSPFERIRWMPGIIFQGLN